MRKSVSVLATGAFAAACGFGGAAGGVLLFHESLVGPSGPPGPQGVQGPPGQQGPQGEASTVAQAVGMTVADMLAEQTRIQSRLAALERDDSRECELTSQVVTDVSLNTRTFGPPNLSVYRSPFLVCLSRS